MKKLSYVVTLAAALVLAGNQMSYAQSQPCPVSKPCPAPCPAEQKPCPAPCPCPTETQNLPCPCKNPESSTLSIPDTLSAQPCFKTFSKLLQYAGYAKILRGQGPYTVFAPSDDAFCKLPKGTVESLMCPENKCKLEKILRYHIVNEAVPCASLTCPTKIKTSEGECLTITPANGQLTVNNAQVLKGDICTKSGKIYTIDTVLMPSK